jgi:general secretion pathway protein F
MTLLGTVVLFFLLTYVIPSVTSIFSDMNQVLPAPTRFLITISDSLKAYWWIILITIAGAAVTFRGVRKMTKGRYFIDKTILSLPVIGLLVKKLAAARCSRTLGSLLENGVPMLSALEIVKNIVGNAMISDTIENASKEVEKGQGLGTALAEGKILPDLSIQMIQVGEQSGKLEAMLNKVADVFENEVESSIATMTSLVEPVMLLIMGAIVMFIVLSILLPIFEMNQLVM